MDVDVLELIAKVQAAYTKVKEREEVKDQASAAFVAARQDYEKAADELNAYRVQLNDILGTTTSDPRVRQG